MGKYVDGQWQSMTMKENIAFTDVAYCVPKRGYVYDSYSVATIYDRENFVPGKYRILTGIDLKTADRYVEFEIPTKYIL